MLTDMREFFEAVSSRMWKENDLSDMTFALCQSNARFKQFFLDYFFQDAAINAERAVLRREVSVEGARPDFWIDVEGLGVYVIEVKIWDHCHHFDQYLDMLCKENLSREVAYSHIGYIANYEITPTEAGYADRLDEFVKFREPKQWSEFFAALRKEVSVDGFAGGDVAVVGYLNYLRRVCGIRNYEAESPVGKDLISAIEWLEKTVSVAIREAANQNEAEFYTRSSSCVDFTYRKGQFFKFQHHGDVYGFIGVYFGGECGDQARFAVVMEDRPGWAKNVCDEHREMVHEGGLWFYPSESELMNMSEFLLKVIRYIKNPRGVDYPGRVAVAQPSCRILRQIMLVDRKIKQVVLNFKNEKPEYSVSYYPNSRPMKNGFGEYFSLEIPSLSVKVWAWTGFVSGKLGPVIKFRGDWDRKGVWANEKEREILSKDNVTIKEYSDAFRRTVAELAEKIFRRV